jgi:hypothetical protein
VCGAWPDVKPGDPIRHFKIRDNDTLLTLCNVCWLEEVLSDQGDLKDRLKIGGEQDLVTAPERPQPETDKFCPACNRRLALLKTMAHRLTEKELESWRE